MLLVTVNPTPTLGSSAATRVDAAIIHHLSQQCAPQANNFSWTSCCDESAFGSSDVLSQQLKLVKKTC